LEEYVKVIENFALEEYVKVIENFALEEYVEVIEHVALVENEHLDVASSLEIDDHYQVIENSLIQDFVVVFHLVILYLSVRDFVVFLQVIERYLKLDFHEDYELPWELVLQEAFDSFDQVEVVLVFDVLVIDYLPSLDLNEENHVDLRKMEILYHVKVLEIVYLALMVFDVQVVVNMEVDYNNHHHMYYLDVPFHNHNNHFLQYVVVDKLVVDKLDGKVVFEVEDEIVVENFDFV
jgi:hypothetical protein